MAVRISPVRFYWCCLCGHPLVYISRISGKGCRHGRKERGYGEKNGYRTDAPRHIPAAFVLCCSYLFRDIGHGKLDCERLDAYLPEATVRAGSGSGWTVGDRLYPDRSEEHTSEL